MWIILGLVFAFGSLTLFLMGTVAASLDQHQTKWHMYIAANAALLIAFLPFSLLLRNFAADNQSSCTRMPIQLQQEAIVPCRVRNREEENHSRGFVQNLASRNIPNSVQQDDYLEFMRIPTSTNDLPPSYEIALHMQNDRRRNSVV